MKFNNKENPRHTLNSGRVLFESRSVAVLAMTLVKEGDKFFALVGKRGPAVTRSNEWGMVCGYLDWDETLPDAVCRELWEEAGVDLRSMHEGGPWKYDGSVRLPDQPDYVSHSPATSIQNITMRYIVELPERVPVHPGNAEPGEVLEVEWLEVTQENLDGRTWAFNHYDLLQEFLEWVEKERASRPAPLGPNTIDLFARTR